MPLVSCSDVLFSGRENGESFLGNSPKQTPQRNTHIMEALQKQLEDFTDELDKRTFRPLQKKTFMCSSKCCDDTKQSQEHFQRCIQQCTMEMQQKEATVNNELQVFQQKVQRCAQACNDKAQSFIESSGMETAQRKAMECIDSCASDYGKELAAIRKRVA